MQEIPCPENDEEQCHYLQWHGILREAATSTKLRNVFNLKAKTSNGKSINDYQHKGPKLQQKIDEIIMRNRKFKYIFTCDIEKMFLQIEMLEKDKKFFRLFYRPTDDSPIKVYQFNRVPFGAECSPFIAIRTLYQTCLDNGDDEVTKIISENAYVDDIFFGADHIPECHRLMTKIINTLEAGKFTLSKWGSPDEEVTEIIPQEKRNPNKKAMKMLGVNWNLEDDEFFFNIHLPTKLIFTRRKILSFIASKSSEAVVMKSPAAVVMKSPSKSSAAVVRNLPSKATAAGSQKSSKQKNKIEKFSKVKITKNRISHVKNPLTVTSKEQNGNKEFVIPKIVPKKDYSGFKRTFQMLRAMMVYSFSATSLDPRDDSTKRVKKQFEQKENSLFEIYQQIKNKKLVQKNLEANRNTLAKSIVRVITFRFMAAEHQCNNQTKALRKASNDSSKVIKKLHDIYLRRKLTNESNLSLYLRHTDTIEILTNYSAENVATNSRSIENAYIDMIQATELMRRMNLDPQAFKKLKMYKPLKYDTPKL